MHSTIRHGTAARAGIVALVTTLGASASSPARAAEAWPTAVHARYKLKFNGIEVGRIDFNSKVGAQNYTMGGNGEVSLLFGAIKWTGASTVTGAIEGGSAKPKTYVFDWKKKSKGGAIAMKYAGGKATDVSVDPPPKTDGDIIPLKDEHKVGPVDPMTAIMMLTRADSRAPCERREAVFDGKHRYDIVFSYKRQTRIPASKAGGGSIIGTVCRAMYEPIAGYKNDAHHKAYAANRDAEVVLRPVPGTKLMIPYSVNIPTTWGSGSMVTDRVDVTTSAGQIALTE
jgi:hypothetical protein